MVYCLSGMSYTLRFCSWNIQIGMKRAQLMEIVRAYADFQKLDLVALQETSALGTRPDAASIAEILGATFTSYQNVYHHHGARPQGNGLVWNTRRIQMHAVEQHLLPRVQQTKISRLERAALRPLNRQNRMNVVAEGAFDGLSLRVCSAHLDVLGLRFKRQQFHAVLEELRRRPAVELMILAGDFNTFRIGGRPNWNGLKREAAELGLRAISDEIAWTQAVRSLRFRQKLDEIFVASSHPFRSRVWTLDVNGSDHLPVFAEIVIA